MNVEENEREIRLREKLMAALKPLFDSLPKESVGHLPIGTVFMAELNMYDDPIKINQIMFLILSGFDEHGDVIGVDPNEIANNTWGKNPYRISYQIDKTKQVVRMFT